MDLPHSRQLNIGALSRCFKNTSTPYKFYWFLAILDQIEKQNNVVPKRTLFAGMMANAWYTVNYFKLSFGQQDQLSPKILELKETEGLNTDSTKASVSMKLIKSQNPVTQNHLQHFNAQVPHWFLSPWFHGLKTRAQIYEASKQERIAPYELNQNRIIIDPDWYEYFQIHLEILKAFTYWKLTNYLQTKNPNTPNIGHKLFRPNRTGLEQLKRDFWDKVIKAGDPFYCIYTDELLIQGGYHLDHFIPHAWVSHNMIWNLIPSDPRINNDKRDRLPDIRQFINSYFDRHRRAIEILKNDQTETTKKIITDYYAVFDQLDFTKEQMMNVFTPIFETAQLNGFRKWKI